jgi:hypothetical protein
MGLLTPASAARSPRYDVKQWGEVDLVGRSPEGAPVVIELKGASSNEPPLRGIAEGVAYAIALRQAWRRCFGKQWCDALQIDEGSDCICRTVFALLPNMGTSHWPARASVAGAQSGLEIHSSADARPVRTAVAPLTRPARCRRSAATEGNSRIAVGSRLFRLDRQVHGFASDRPKHGLTNKTWGRCGFTGGYLISRNLLFPGQLVGLVNPVLRDSGSSGEPGQGSSLSVWIFGRAVLGFCGSFFERIGRGFGILYGGTP